MSPSGYRAPRQGGKRRPPDPLPGACQAQEGADLSAHRIELLFDEFAQAYRRGESPDVPTFLARAGGERERQALASLIDRFLQNVPASPPTEEELVLMRARLESEPPLLVLRRDRRRLTRDSVVSALLRSLGLDASKGAKVKRYYSDLEVGVLDPQPVSERVWDALSDVLGANVRLLAGVRPPPPRASAQSYRREANVSPRVVYSLEELPAAPPDVPASERDEVDRLFTGDA